MRNHQELPDERTSEVRRFDCLLNSELFPTDFCSEFIRHQYGGHFSVRCYYIRHADNSKAKSACPNNGIRIHPLEPSPQERDILRNFFPPFSDQAEGSLGYHLIVKSFS
jgi:hypothetical protein